MSDLAKMIAEAEAAEKKAHDAWVAALKAALDAVHGNVKKAAESLGWDYKHAHRKIDEWGLREWLDYAHPRGERIRAANIERWHGEDSTQPGAANRTRNRTAGAAKRTSKKPTK